MHGEIATEGTAQHLEWLVKRIGLTDREHIPVDRVLPTLAGFALRVIAARKTNPKYTPKNSNWTDIFGKYERRKNLGTWEAALDEGFVTDPIEFLDSLPKGSIFRIDISQLEDVQTEKKPETSEEMLRRLTAKYD
jgi:hypothetical protein